MAIPTATDLYLPILTMLSQANQDLSPREMADTLKPKLGVTDADMQNTRQDGYPTYYENVHGVLARLKKDGLIDISKYAHYHLTDKGRSFLAQPDKFNKRLS